MKRKRQVIFDYQRRVELSCMVLPETKDILESTWSRTGIFSGPVDVGQLLDLVAQHMERFIESLPDEARGRFWGATRLTDVQVREIRASAEKLVSIGLQYGIDPSMVSLIRNGKRYAWVK